MQHAHRYIRRTLALLTLMAAGCREAATAPAAPDDVPALEPATVMAVLQREPTSPSGTVRYTVRVVARELDFAAYQGALTFAPGGLELVSLETPTGADGESRVVNSGEMSAGRIRFAAFATERFSSDRVFTVTLRVLDPRAEASLRAQLDLVGTPMGAAISSEAIVRAADQR